MEEKILIIDFGSQYTQLIARRLRELSVYCEIYPYNNIPTINDDDGVKGVILSGSPASVLDDDAPVPKSMDFQKKLPLLGICYGAQLIAINEGADVVHGSSREFGRANLVYIDNDNALFNKLDHGSQVWMSHADTIINLPVHCKIIASTHDVEVAGFMINEKNIYGLQFHPEVYHTQDGKQLLHNFVVGICGCKRNWTPDSFIESIVEELKDKLKNDKVVLGLSGGVDSSVAAKLLHQAIGDNLYCIFVNNGLLRKNEYKDVLHSYEDMGLNITGVDASGRFLDSLKGIKDPEEKRKAIGRTFIEVFDDEANKIKNVKWLGQGTIYPDIIESVSVKGPSVTIKSHHNVGGLPDHMNLKVVEPLKSLFKDEVRLVGKALGMSSSILGRHPFPGPGLSVRILGEVTKEKVKLLQDVDHIFINGLKRSGWYEKVWQAAAVLLPVQSVGVMGDERTYQSVVALRVVNSTDGMTADWSHLPYELLGTLSNEIINKVKGVNRVVYDISSKPPATVEWE